jgi:hypothetical protein
VKHISGIVLTDAEAELLATAALHYNTLAARHGMRLNPRLLALAAQIRSTDGNTEPTPAVETEVHEQVTAERAATILDCSPRNVRALAARGRLPGTKNGGQWFFSLDDVETLKEFR